MPGFTIKVVPQGTKTPTPLDQSERVKTFKFDDVEKAADKLTLTVDNFDLANFDNPVWADGNLLRVSWGYDGNMALERELVIKSVKGFTVLAVEALAKSVLMNQQRRTAKFEKMTYSQIAKKVAQANGYTDATKLLIDDSLIVFDCVMQTGVSDAMFLRHLANKLHWQFFVDFDGFHFHPRKMGQRPLRTFTYYVDPNESEMLDVHIENDVTARPQGPQGSVQLKGRDPKKKGKDIDATGDNDSTKGHDVVSDIPKVVDKATGERNYIPYASVSALLPTTAPTQAAAEQKSKNAYVQAQQRTVKLSFKAVGDPNIVAKSIIVCIFPGAKSISGRYYVTEATHQMGEGQGYEIELKCRRDGSTSVGSGLGGAKETKTEGKKNQQDPSDPGALTPSKKVDGATGARTTIFTNTKGRAGK